MISDDLSRKLLYYYSFQSIHKSKLMIYFSLLLLFEHLCNQIKLILLSTLFLLLSTFYTYVPCSYGWIWSNFWGSLQNTIRCAREI